MHALFDEKPWFAPKRFGLGAGAPIAWQGWAMLLAHVMLIAGAVLATVSHPVVMTLTALAVGLAPLPLYAAKTRGGWHWRWGDRA